MPEGKWQWIGIVLGCALVLAVLLVVLNNL